MNFTQKLCPFCKKDNSCNVINAKSCWCMKTKVPQELKDLLKKDDVLKSCICQTCVLEFNENASAFIQKYKLT